MRAKLSSIRRAADFAEAIRKERHPLFKIPGGDEERRYNVKSAKSMLAWLIKNRKGVNESTAVTYVKSAVREVSRAADVNILPEVSSLKEAYQRAGKAAPPTKKAAAFGAVHILWAIRGGALPTSALDPGYRQRLHEAGATLLLWAKSMRTCEIGDPRLRSGRDGPGLLWKHVKLVTTAGIEDHWVFLIYPAKKRKSVHRITCREPADTILGKIMTSMTKQRKNDDDHTLVFEDTATGMSRRHQAGDMIPFSTTRTSEIQTEWRAMAEQAGGPRAIRSTSRGARAGGYTDTTEILEPGTDAEKLARDHVKQSTGRWDSATGKMPAEYDRRSVLAELARARAMYTAGPSS